MIETSSLSLSSDDSQAPFSTLTGLSLAPDVLCFPIYAYSGLAQLPKCNLSAPRHLAKYW